jgi:hypothetical protein
MNTAPIQCSADQPRSINKSALAQSCDDSSPAIMSFAASWMHADLFDARSASQSRVPSGNPSARPSFMVQIWEPSDKTSDRASTQRRQQTLTLSPRFYQYVLLIGVPLLIRDSLISCISLTILLDKAYCSVEIGDRSFGY